MQGKGGCVDGHLVTTWYGSPLPLIGLYIAAATLVCFFCITFDLVYGLFIRKKPFVPCKFFTMNAFTMTVLAVAIKIPVDLTTPMPRVEDQLSKLTGTALLCTSLGFYIPSLGTLGTSERYGNLAALSVMVITMIVNVCMQMGTGVIFAFILEHIIIMVCISVLLLLMWSSAISCKGQKKPGIVHYKSKISEDIDSTKDVQGLRKLLVKLHVLNYTGNPQILLCETSHHHVFGLLCALSLAVLLEAMLRSFAPKNMRSCNSGGVISDYRWSIPIVIVVQFLTIGVGTFSIIYRWLSSVSHADKRDLWAHEVAYDPKRELEYLKLNLSFGFISKSFSNVFLVAKDFIMDLLIRTQIMLFTCSSIIEIPICIVKEFLEYIAPFIDHVFHKCTEDTQEMHTSTVLSSLKDFGPFNDWIAKMAMKDMMRWENTYKRDHLTHLVQLMSKCSASKSECALFIRKLEATQECLGKKLGVKYEYKVSCASVLVLSGLLAELMPSSSGESLMHSLNESFEIIYYVDQRTTDNPSIVDETKWMSVKGVWAQWENPNHWFRTEIISHSFKNCPLKKSEESELQLHHALGVLEDSVTSMKNYVGAFKRCIFSAVYPLDRQHMALFAFETLIICELICEQKFETVKNLFDFLEECFIKMLCFFLSRLPLALLKEIHVEDPTEIGEGRVRKAFKFLHELELLRDTKIEWSWPSKFDFESQVQANDVHSLVQAQPNQNSSTSTTVVADLDSSCSEVDGKIGNSGASLAAAAAAAACAVDDTNKEIGPDEIV